MRIINFEEKKEKSTHRELNKQNGGEAKRIKYCKDFLPKKIWIPLVVMLGLAVLTIIPIVIYKILTHTKKPPDNYLEKNTIIKVDALKEVEDGIKTPDLGPINVEFSVKTVLNELRKIKVEQIIRELNFENKEKEENLLYRITYYDIVIFKEKKSDKNQEKYFNKTYTGTIAISSECLSTEKEECQPQKRVDLNANSAGNEEITDLKDIPVALCLFEMTDNDVIISITCPESLSKSLKDRIVLDLYFWKPPSIERPNKNNVNITIEKKEDNITIRDIDIGICSIDSPFYSNCTTDFNLTTDLEGNVLKYNEFCFSNITKNENNYFIKNKYTKLSDETKNYNNLNYEKYYDKLNKILPLLEPYMKYNQLFNYTQFKHLYNTCKNATNEENERNLGQKEENKEINNEAILFSYSHLPSGKVYNLIYKKNPGINSNYFEYFNDFKYGEKNYNIIHEKEYSNFDEILKKLSILSKAGEKHISSLYNDLNNYFIDLDEIIKNNTLKLKDLIFYQDILKFFDSSFSMNNLTILPYQVLEYSDNLKNELDNILNNIMNGDFKNYIENFKTDVNNYIRNSHEIVFELEQNLKSLTNSLKSRKNEYTEIATYYLNNTPDSYSDRISKAEEIFMNYYKFEYNYTISKVESFLENFENRVRNSLKYQTDILNKLLEKLENKSIIIDGVNEENSQKIIANLKNSNNYVNEIILQIKQKIIKALGLYENNYFLSNREIENNNNIFIPLINESLTVAKKLDNDDYIDKYFDMIMSHFKENIIKVIKSIDKIKQQYFTLNDNSFKYGYFPSSEKSEIAGNIRDLYSEISRKLNREKDYYSEKLKEELENFLVQNKDELKKIINEIMILFSEEDLKKLADLYKNGFESSKNILSQFISSNINLTENYFYEINDFIFNESKNAEPAFLHEYMQGNLSYKREEWSASHYVYLKSHKESDIKKTLTLGYKNKLKKYRNHFQNSINYIKNQIFSDYLNEYKKAIIKLKNLLQTIKNTEITSLYPSLINLKFTDDNIEKINELYTRLNKYFSDEIFNQEYLYQINDFKETNIQELENATSYFEKINNNIDINNFIPDISKDVCYSFKTKAFYTCTNGQLSYYIYSNDSYCYYLINSENSKYLKDISIYSIEDINIYNNRFKKFYESIEKKVINYESKMKELRDILSSVKKDALEQNFTDNYLLPFNDYINSKLEEKYGDKIINDSYNYYKIDSETKINEILPNISNKWDNIYNLLNNEIEENFHNLKSGTCEFGIMAQIISFLINSNITRDFFNSIISHQKNEFNYLIASNYNYLLRLIKSANKYVVNQMSIKKNGFDDIVDLRKKEINKYFQDLIEKLNELKEKSCSPKNQNEILDISKNNFFGVQSILSETIKKMNDSLTNKAAKPYNFYKENDQYSFINRFYLENSQIGDQIKQFYEEIEKKEFTKLKLDIFLDIIKENLIFNKNEFINKIEEILPNSNLKIENALYNEKKEYISILESLITEYFTKDGIIYEINNLYKNQVKEMEQKNIEEIKNNINEILNELKEKIFNEANRLKTTSVSYTTNFTKIEITLNEYKNKIFNELNSTVFIVLNDFYNIINEKLLKNYVEPMFEEFLNKAKIFTSDFNEFNTLNSTFNIKNIILDIVEDLSIEYREITEIQIKHKYEEYFEDIKNKLGLDNLKYTINFEIENSYNLTLFPALNDSAIDIKEDLDYSIYDFSKEIKDEIDEIIESKINNISNIVLITKGNSFKINLSSWNSGFDDNEKYDIIERKFKSFILNQVEEENENMNNEVKDILESNFKELTRELILTFGKDFFDRIIKYNENFKITNLYNNLKYSLFQTMSYYIMINAIEVVEELPKDLKTKLYNLNNMDLIAKEKNKKVLDLLEGYIDDFIKESKVEIISLYISYVKQYIIKDKIFNDKITDIISSQLIDMRDEEKSDVGNYYTNLLEYHFKSEFITCYTNSMNRQLNELIELIKDEKKQLEVELDYCFTLDPEEVLNEINYKGNLTSNTINEFYENEFNISSDFQNYLNNYGNEAIQPVYENIINLIDQSTKEIVLSEINSNIHYYEKNLNINEFKEISNYTYLESSEIFNKMKRSIDIYGIEDFYDNLENEIKNIEMTNLRRLNGEPTKDIQDIINTNIEDTFKKLLGYSENTKLLINSSEVFAQFKKNISENLDNLEKSFKDSKKQIIKNNYQDDIKNYLFEKLNYLKNITSNYYISINETFYKIKDYLENSNLKINILLNRCENMTYIAFSRKYEEISGEVQELDKNYDTDKEEETVLDKIPWENNNLEVTAEFGKFIQKGKLKFSYKYEKGSSPRLNVEFRDEGKPEKLDLKIEEKYGDSCGEKVEEINVEFKGVSYITYIDYNVSDNTINMTTITNFESFDYYIIKYKIDASNGVVCRNVMGTEICTGSQNACSPNPKTHKKENQKNFYKVDTVILEA